MYHENHKYFKETIFRNLDDNKGDKSFIKSDFKWFRSGYVDIPYNKGINLKGDFQSWKYFQNIENEIKNIFSIPDTILNDIKDSKYGFLLNEKNIGIHIRRGDYVNNQDQYNLLGVEYIKKSLQLVTEILKNNNQNNILKIDLRQKNQIIING